MPSLKLSVAAALLAVASAAPTDTVKGFTKNNIPEGAFRVEQVPNPKFSGKHGATAVFKAHKKFGATPPSHVVAAVDRVAAVAAAQQSGKVPAVPGQYDEEYLEPVKIGSKTFQIDFDTGSSDLWVLGSGVGASGHTTYSGGGTRVSGESWSIQYGDGSSASGVVYRDTVNVGGAVVNGQAVEVATQASSAFTQGADDGLLGLAFGSINTCSPNQCVTFFDNVKSSLPSKLFTADLKAGRTGSYTFGYIDNSIPTSSIAYTSIDNSQGFWSFQPSGAKVGSSSVGSRSTLTGIADTGTTLILIDDSVASAYYSQVRGAQNSNQEGGYIFPCSASLPNFSLLVGGQTFTVPGSYINYAPNGDGTCFGGIQSSSGIGFNIYGDVFLKAVYTVFDQSQGSPRIGFASKSL